MKKLLNRLFLFVFFLFFAQAGNAQCYVRMEDASGFNTDPYQDTLEAVAAKLCAIFDSTGFPGQFKVYDFGFYLHQESTNGGYPEPFAQKIAEVQGLSPYYLLFGKQTDKGGVYTRFWVDLVLPDTGKFSCLTNIQRQIIHESIKGAVNSDYNKNNRLSFYYYSAEIAGLDTLGKRLIKVFECCFARSVDCYACLSINESVDLLRDQHGVNISTNEIYQLFGNSCFQENTFCDYLITNSEFNRQENPFIRKSNFIKLAAEFGCPTSVDVPDLVSYDLSNSSMSEEPKWGQLGTWQDIVNEINSLNFIGLTLLQQVKLIANHFECNVFYTRNNEGRIVYDYSRSHFCVVSRYVYSTTYGWIDFHHVFKIFEWGVEQMESGNLSLIQAANIAQITGYEGEMYQYLKGNESGFSYEDLCSNHVGAMLFLNNYNIMKNSENTWAGQVSIACSNLNFIAPKDAPNYEYIPYILDGNLPKNLSQNSCLTGDELKNKHRESFSKKRLQTQLNTISVHEEFPD